MSSSTSTSTACWSTARTGSQNTAAISISGLVDTMKDLLVNFIGAVIFSIIGFFYVKSRGKGKFASAIHPARALALAQGQKRPAEKITQRSPPAREGFFSILRGFIPSMLRMGSALRYSHAISNVASPLEPVPAYAAVTKNPLPSKSAANVSPMLTAFWAAGSAATPSSVLG